MPNFTITQVPVQLSQSITQESLIQNTGSKSVYLSNNSAGSSDFADLIVAAKTTVNWPANADLWAVCAPGETSNLSVLYGAKGASVGDITATIANPVNVQGGAVLVLNYDYSLTTGQFQLLSIPLPPDGVTYYGLDVQLLNTTVSGAAGTNGVVTVDIYNSFDRNTMSVDGSGTQSNEIGTFGSINLASMTLPLNTQYPVTASLFNDSPNTVGGTLTVFATSYAFPYVVDSTPNIFNNWTISAGNQTAGKFISIPASVQPRRFRGYFLAALSGFNLTYWDPNTSAYADLISDVQLTQYLRGAAPPASDTYSVFDIDIPPAPVPMRLTFTVAHTGNWRITNLGVLR